VSQTILVTDGEERSALAVVRSLGHAGYRVVVCARAARSLAAASRFAHRGVAVPDALREPDAFAVAVAALARAEGAQFVLPIGEASLLAILERRGELPDDAVPWPSLDVVRAVCDKARVLEAAATLGIGVPRQVLLTDRRDQSAHGLTFPLVAKPARSVGESRGVRGKFRVAHAASDAELQQVLGAFGSGAWPILLQERVVGPGVGIFLLLWEGQVRAAFSHRRIREKPPAGGVSVYREAIPADPALVARSVALLEYFGWDGVAMVEYKVDERTGTPVLMEINGRFWGSLQLAVDAGVDFPRLLLECAEGHPPPGPAAYDPSVRLRWWWGEVDHVLARLLKGTAELGLPPGSPSRSQAVHDFFRRHPRDRSETWRADDPAPFRVESMRWLSGQ
jgi:predicted ATP-grasp superfamily ATP-dependent carboligase